MGQSGVLRAGDRNHHVQYVALVSCGHVYPVVVLLSFAQRQGGSPSESGVRLLDRSGDGADQRAVRPRRRYGVVLHPRKPDHGGSSDLRDFGSRHAQFRSHLVHQLQLRHDRRETDISFRPGGTGAGPDPVHDLSLHSAAARPVRRDQHGTAVSGTGQSRRYEAAA